MAGAVSLAPGRLWSSAGWLFDWVVEFLAANVTTPGLKDDLDEIVAANLGWLGLDDYGPEAEAR